MQIKSLLLLLLTFSLNACAQKTVPVGDCEPPNHQPWTQLLQTHVDDAGWVSYKSFVADSVRLNNYLETISKCPPHPSWSEEEKLAYWINAYNAFTIKLIVDNYPVISIKKIKKGISFINSVWDIKFFEIAGEKMDLNTIEHSIIRKEFDEPRIHFAIVCASISCPKLLNEAYEAETLDEQLTQQAKTFVNDAAKNQIEKKQIKISPIFKWFSEDFTKKGTIQEFIRPYSEYNFDADAKVKYSNYDWNLNGE